MFMGMSFCLPLAYYLERKEAEKKALAATSEAAEPLLVQPGEVRADFGGGRWRRREGIGYC